jgi:hypothetical protein
MLKKTTIIKIGIYFAAFGLPILGMLNCSGWSESDMKVESCIIDAQFLRDYAAFYYNFLLISSFTVLIPLIIYVLLVVFIAKKIAKSPNSNNKKPKTVDLE